MTGLFLEDVSPYFKRDLLAPASWTLHPVYVKEQMGHHSISITVDIYGHWISSGNRDAVNRLGQQITASHVQVG